MFALWLQKKTAVLMLELHHLGDVRLFSEHTASSLHTTASDIEYCTTDREVDFVITLMAPKLLIFIWLWPSPHSESTSFIVHE